MTLNQITEQTRYAQIIISDTITSLSMIPDEPCESSHLANSLSHELMQAWHHLNNAREQGGHHANDGL